MHILRVMPQREFRVRDQLHDLGLAAYVPIEFQTTWYPKGRSVTRRLPLIRGYVFAAVDDWMPVRAIAEVTGALLLDGAPVTLTAAEMAAVEALSRPMQRAIPSATWVRGDAVTIRRGAWAQLTGVVDRIERGKVVAVVEMFGKRSEVRLDPAVVEAA